MLLVQLRGREREREREIKRKKKTKKILGCSKLDSLEAKGNHLTDIPEKTLALKGTNSSQTSVIVQRNISPNNNLEKLAREAQQLALEKEKTRLKIQ